LVAEGQVTPSDLQTEIEAGRIKFISANGNGYSSGNAVDGYIENATSASKRVRVNLLRPLFLKNGGSGQNMVAVQMYNADMSYYGDGQNSYIELGPKQRAKISYVAYCVDFDKDNPDYLERFTIGDIPPDLEAVVARICQYSARNPNTDILSAAQAAIWLAQGKSIAEIREKYDVSPYEESIARGFLR